MNSKVRRASIAAVCALGATIATISPAHATGLAAYDCGTAGNPVGFRFDRTPPTTPPSKNLRVQAPIGFFTAVPIAVGALSAMLIGPPSPPYPLTMTNPNVLAAGSYFSINLTGVSPVGLTVPPTAIFASTTTPPGTIAGLPVGCGLISWTVGTWPI